MNDCHDCRVKEGEYHIVGCDWERCPKCGGQYISCGCDDAETYGLDRIRYESEKDTPSKRGVEFYLEGDGYYIANCDRVPCTCNDSCTYSCKGQCGCKACHQAYQDFGYG